MSSKKVAIVIPAYNEGNAINQTIFQLVPLGYQIIIVDDCSVEPVTNFVKESDSVLVVRHPINLGQGAALQTGMTLALKNKFDFIVHFDADGQHPTEGIADALKELEDETFDIILGSRFLKKEHVQEIPGARRILLRIARWINFLFTGVLLTDAHNGFRVMRASAAEKLKITQNRMSHATEVITLIKSAGLSYKEMPTQIIYTEHSMAKGQHALNSVNIVFDLLIKRFMK